MSKCNSRIKLQKIKSLRIKFKLPILTITSNNHTYCLQLDDGRMIYLDRKTGRFELDIGNKWSVEAYKENMPVEALAEWEIEKLKLDYNYEFLNKFKEDKSMICYSKMCLSYEYTHIDKELFLISIDTARNIKL